MEGMEPPCEEDMACAFNGCFAHRSFNALGECMCEGSEDIVAQGMEMVSAMITGEICVEDMLANMDGQMCEEMMAMFEKMGEFNCCMLDELDWKCEMGTPKYDNIRADLGMENLCMEQMCCGMAR